MASLGPSPMEAKGVAASNGVPATVLRKEAALSRQGAAKVWGDE